MADLASRLKNRTQPSSDATAVDPDAVEHAFGAIALSLAYNNLCKFHGSLRMTPAMAAGVQNSAWTIADFIDAAS